MRRAMQQSNLRAAVTTHKAPVVRGADALALPRYDCIDLPPRKSAAPGELGLS